MLTLDLLKATRISKRFRRGHLAELTGITEDRLRELELRQSEPWFDEACILSRALCVDGIVPLITSDNPTLSSIESPLPGDVELWRGGLRPPLALAMRVAATFGLTDPIELSVTPLHRQIWDTLEASERVPEAQGRCPWCRGINGAHRGTCLPANLWTAPAELHIGDELPSVIPRPQRRVQRTKGIPAYGLRALREEREMRQVDVAELIGVHPNYYARIERSDLPLTVELADILSARWNVDRSVLYARPAGEA